MSNHWHNRFQDENFVYGTEPNVFLSEIQKKLQLSGDALAIAEGEAELDWKKPVNGCSFECYGRQNP